MSDDGRDEPTQSMPPHGEPDEAAGDGPGGDAPDGEGWSDIPGQPQFGGRPGPDPRSPEATSALTFGGDDPAWAMTRPGEDGSPTPDEPAAPDSPGVPDEAPGGGWDRPGETAIAPTTYGAAAGGEADGADGPVYGPGGPYGGGGGGGGDDGGDLPPGEDEPLEPEEPVPWYRQRGPMAALIAGVVAIVMIVIAIFVLAGDDDTDTIDAGVSSTSSTVDATTTTRRDRPRRTTTTSVPPTAAPTTTAPPTTQPPTTTLPPTTTTTTPPTTTAPPTTRPPTTTQPPTTTTVPPPVVSIPPQQEPTAWDILDSSPDLSKARDYVEQADLRDVVDDPEAPVTFLAPTNDAFTLVEESPGGQDLLADDERLRELLERHIVEDRRSADDIFSQDELETISGDVLEIDGDAETIEGDARIVAADIEQGGGVIQAIDRVLLA